MSATAYIGNYYGNKFLQTYLLNQPSWLSLNTDEPTVLGDPATELAGTVRQRLAWHPPNAKTIVNSTPLTFVGLIAAKLTWLSFWDSLTGGNMIGAFKLNPAIDVTDSGHFLVAAGDLAFSL